MKYFKYLLIILGGLLTGFFPLMDIIIGQAEVAPLDDNPQPINNFHITINQIAIIALLVICGALAGWLVNLIHCWLTKRFFK